MNKLSKALVLACASVAFSSPAFATTVIWDGTGFTDSFMWGQLGPSFTVVPSGTVATSANGATVTISDSDGSVQRRDQGNGWNGSFGAGEQLLFNQGSGVLTFNFAAPVMAAGAQIQSDVFGAFIARLTTSDGSFFDIAGNSNSQGGDTNPFLGAISDTANITSISFNLQTNGSSFAISQLNTIGGRQAPAVPEPGTWAMMLLGFGGMGIAMRKRRTGIAVRAMA